MILTGRRISEEVAAGKITLEPFVQSQVNPNSYNYRLGTQIMVSDPQSGQFEKLEIPRDGYVLAARRLALANTLEKIGSTAYAMSLIGRSSIGRLGLFVQVSANLGHTTSSHCWTLELFAAKSIRLYPGMTIGQVSFWKNSGAIVARPGTYAGFDDPKQAVPSVMGVSEVHR